MFPNNAKIACVSPLDKDTDDKYSVTNFQSVNVLNIFAKFVKKSKKTFD